ncbi:class I SAM-dependent methyltransferase, partial [Thermodesulfobacteriota bacterium]
EVGCGRGVGSEIILDLFGADEVDAFDLDPRMIEKASRRLEPRGDKVRLWTGDATDINADDCSYNAVFDFGIIHHIPNWRDALAEVHRVLKPGGRFYAEEVLERYIIHPLWQRLLAHPEEDRFDEAGFADALGAAGFAVSATSQLWNQFAWFIADKS